MTVSPLRWSRRGILGAGALLGLGHLRVLKAAPGLSSDNPEGESFAALPPKRAQRVIQIFLPGGMAHQESFDPKPLAPLAYRGDVRAIHTKIPGLQFSRHLERTAEIADRLTVIRSFTHGEAAHERGSHNILTGFRPSPAVVYPSLGSLIAHELGPRASLPPYVCIPNTPHLYAGTGYLPSSFAPFSLGSDPAKDNFKVRDLGLPDGVDGARFERRRGLLDTIDAGFRAGAGVDAVGAMGSFYQRAYELLASSAAVEAFRIQDEPDKVRDRYGRHAAGQRLCLARRLVESGVRWVTVTVGGWDHHQNISQRMREQLPPLDQAFAALILDLEERGLLDETLVLLASEFGRTPKLNPEGGRDHWPGVYSIVLAGGGVKRGLAHGRSDATASGPEEKAVGPQDLARTVLTMTGVDPEKTLMAGGNRPLKILKGGRLLKEILA